MKLLTIMKNLTHREKYAVCGALGIILLLLLHQVVLTPLVESKSRMSRVLASKVQTSRDISALRSEYLAIREQENLSKSKFTDRKQNFTLFSFLDEQAGEAGMKAHIAYMRPSTTTPKDSPFRIAQVEMKFQNVTMKQLATYLHKIETSRNQIIVKRLSVSKDAKQTGFIDAVLQVITSET